MVFFSQDSQPKRRGNIGIGLLIAAFAIVSYCSSQEKNDVTGKTQYLAMSTKEEIALGLQSAPIMADQYGGLSSNATASARVNRVGENLVSANRADIAQWRFQFHVLSDAKTINAFALPGGQIFITEGLLNRLKTDDQLAGVLSHEMGHVAGRHSAAQLAKQRLSQGLTGAVVVASGDSHSSQIAAVAGQLINLRYGRADELESDMLALRFMPRAGYDPHGMLEVLQILKQASSGHGGPAFFSTHPDPDLRIRQLKQEMAKTIE